MMLIAGALLITLAVQDAPPADSAPRARMIVLPVASWSEVTGIQYGATVLRSFRVGKDSATRASSLSMYAAATTKHHVKFYGQLDRWAAGNANRSRLRVDYISYPLPFYGIGPYTETEAEEWYSSGAGTLQLYTDQRFRPSTYLHVGTRYVRSRMREKEEDGQLAQGTIPGAGGSEMFTGELGLVIDSRDLVGAPRRGTYVRVIPSLASKSVGSDFSFQRLTIDARGYRSNSSGYITAFQVQYDGIAGTAPFDLMPMIGADTAMRAYPRGRFRDQQAFTTQVELRSPYWRRVGFATFAGVGTVAPTFSDFIQRPWYPTLGAGLRYLLLLKDRTIARADFGVGRGGAFGFIVGIGEAF